jgi:hypothetical protein
MKSETYSALLKDLQKLQKAIVSSQIAAVRRDPTLSATLQRLHVEAEVGGRLDDFVATVARKSTVLLLLRTVFVRVLEDLGILGVKRIRDEWGFAAFREVAPALGIRAYLAFVFRDLAVDFPALFAPGEDELPLPDEDACRSLWNLWHHPNKDGELYVWNGDGFDSRFLGDLYQDLDADIRKRYALLQTPRFVEEYILDHTLTPALAEFDPEALRAKGERFRLLDPTCGSGHFLIGAFHRLADYWRDRHGLSEWAACERALESVWGCDINPHAVDIADFRLLLEVVARTGVRNLDRLAELKLNLRAMDSLIPWERAAKQGELFPAKDRLDAYATASQRSENAAFLGRAFHVVVGNPPYIQPKDVGKGEDYREFWPVSCFKEYALSGPFIERWFGLPVRGGWAGQITANSFMRRSFGKPIVEAILPRVDLQAVIDTSGAYIPGHGTPTVILIGRSGEPRSGQIVAIQSKRGEPKRPDIPHEGLVWRAIATATWASPSDASPFVTVASLPRQSLAVHPWSLSGGEAPRLAADLARGRPVLRDRLAAVGAYTITRAGDLLEVPGDEARRFNLESTVLRPYVIGEEVRDWMLSPQQVVPIPYDDNFELMPLSTTPALLRFLWPHRTWLSRRFVSGGRRLCDAGAPHHDVPQFPKYKNRNRLSLPFAFVSTHNQFALERGKNVFDRSAPVIKLVSGATLEDHLDALGLLNSSTLGFWMKQVFHNKGSSSGDAIRSEDWEPFFDYDATKIQQAPIVSQDREARVALAKALDAAARERATGLPGAVLAGTAWSPTSLKAELSAAHDRYREHTRRMVAVQEELDWLTYGSYGLIDSLTVVAPDATEPLAPGHRPFEIVLARKEDEAAEDEKSAWWSRHGHERVTEIPGGYSLEHRARLQQRIDLIDSDSRLALLESPPYKRRWQLPDWEAETRKAAESWLLNRLEELFAPGANTVPRGPLADPKPYRLEDVAAAWSRDPRVAAVAGVWTGTGLSVDLTLVAEKLVRANGLPDNANRVYSDEGVRKLAEWKRVWALQDQEDAWERAAHDAKAGGEPASKKKFVDPDDPTKELDSIPTPTKFDKTDFAKVEYFGARGKLNIPRERFIIFADLTPNRFGWNGWRDRERALAQVEAFSIAENDPQQPMPVPTTDEPRRCGVTYGLWESLPDVRRWGVPEEHAELQALAREACRQQRCPCPILEAWNTKVLNAKATDTVNSKGTAAKKGRIPKSSDEAVPEPTVSIAARAWVASLFQPGKDLDAAGAWSRHRSRLAEPPQSTIPGIAAGPVQLRMPEVAGGPPPELVTLDPTQLAAILDDLVASGDLQAKGRGTKKRFQLVPRGSSS